MGTGRSVSWLERQEHLSQRAEGKRFAGGGPGPRVWGNWFEMDRRKKESQGPGSTGLVSSRNHATVDSGTR